MKEGTKKLNPKKAVSSSESEDEDSSSYYSEQSGDNDSNREDSFDSALSPDQKKIKTL